MSEVLAGTCFKYNLNKASPTSTHCAILIPGISGGVFSDKYDALQAALQQRNISLLRAEGWDSSTLGTRTLQQLHAGITSLVEFLLSQGYTEITAIGKSFGGMLLLTSNEFRFSRMVLWAPAVSIAPIETATQLRDMPLGEITSIFDIKITEVQLQSFTIPMLIIQGTADQSISPANSETLVSCLPNAKLRKIEAMEHTPKGDEIQFVNEYTVAFLQIR